MRLVQLALVLMLGAPGLTARAADVPAPPATLAEAMENFGRGFLKADTVVRKADSDPSSITSPPTSNIFIN